jgi:hypothetical protein
MSIPSVALAQNRLRAFGVKGRKLSGPAQALEDLLTRIHMRQYPDTIPVLASYWLKTVYSAGHNLPWWSELSTGIGRALAERGLDGIAAESLKNVQSWIKQDVLRKHRAPQARARLAPPFRPELTESQAAGYICRLLNEWLPGEVAQLLTNDMEHLQPDDDGMPCLAVGKAVERLVYREHFSPETLERLLQAGVVHAYPGHVEILRDIVLALLGRTSAPAAPVLPATPLVIAGGPGLPADIAEAVKRAFLVARGDDQELHVPLAEAQALELLKRNDPVRIRSIVVTTDGRWWQSERLQGGAESALIYRAGDRLRIDFTSEHAKLTVPWPDSEAYWHGDVRLPEHVQVFGREWRGIAWERTAERAWLRLEFVRVLRMRDTDEEANTWGPRLQPASVEMAWSEVEQALTSALSRRSTAAIDQLRREDLIPLAHAILRLVESVVRPSQQMREEVERALLSVRYHHGAIAPVYGRIPWRVLPAAAADVFRRRRLDTPLEDVLHQTFEDAPRVSGGPAPRAA